MSETYAIKINETVQDAEEEGGLRTKELFSFNAYARYDSNVEDNIEKIRYALRDSRLSVEATKKTTTEEEI